METGTITYDAGEAQQRGGPLPVKIRSAEGEMIATGVSGSPIPVPPGRYFVSVVTPDGRERGGSDAVTVSPGNAATLSAPPPRVPPPPRMSADDGFAMDSSDDRSLSRAAASPAAPEPGETAEGRLWTGDWFAIWDTGLVASRPAMLEAGLGPVMHLSEQAPTIIGQAAGLDRLLALQLPKVMRYTVVPYDECTACVEETASGREIAASLVMSPNGLQLRYRSTKNEETNTLLSFVDNGVLTEMMTVSEDMVQQGERAIYGAGGSVLRAVTGAYVLLRGNALEGLEAWLSNLEGLSPGLADLPILRAELLARLGRHDEALQQLRIAIGGRVPWFRSGLSYMLERVRLYIDVSENPEVPFRINDAEMPRFIEARARLDRLMGLLCRGRVIATFDVPNPEAD